MGQTEFEQLRKQAQACVRQRKFADAVTLFRKAAEMDDMDADVHEGLATALFMMGQLEDARDEFIRVARLDPRRGRVFINLGAVYNRMKDFKSAADALRKGVQKERKSAQAYYNLGIAQRGLNQSSMAVSAYKEAIRLKPDFAEAHQNLANTYFEMGNHSQAIRSYNKALEIRPEFERAKKGLALAKAASNTAKANYSPFGRLVNEDDIRETKKQEYKSLNDQTRFEDRQSVRESCTAARDASETSVEILHKSLPHSLNEIRHALLQSDNDQLTDCYQELREAIRELSELRNTTRDSMDELKAHEDSMLAENS